MIDPPVPSIPSPTPTFEGGLADEGLADEGLAREARAGSRSAFGMLVERHAAGVLGLFERRLGEPQEAQDLAQDVWIKVYRGLAGYDPSRAFRPWLYSIVLNHLRDLLRRRERSPFARAQSLSDGDGSDPRAPRPSDPSGRIEERAAIEEALAAVSEPFRTALALVDVLGLDYSEAAESEGVALGTMKSRVSRGRAAFRKAYRESSGEEPAPQTELPPASRPVWGTT